MAKNKVTFKTEVVNGKCPTCDQLTMMVNIDGSLSIKKLILE